MFSSQTVGLLSENDSTGTANFNGETSSPRQVPQASNMPRRANRVLVGILDQMPKHIVAEISPSSVSIKANLKIPLIFYGWAGGLLAGTNLVLFKSGTEIFASKQVGGDVSQITLAVTLMAFGMICAAI